MDGSTLLASLAEHADDDTRARVKDLHSRYYSETASLLRRLPGARELLERVEALGLQVVLATSAPVTSSADVDIAKPQPDIIQVALDHAGVDGSRAVFVGRPVRAHRQHIDRSVDQGITGPLRHVGKLHYVLINCPIRYCDSHFSNRPRDHPRTRTRRSKSTGSVASQTRSTASS